jgi:hypothetical protein
MVATVPFVKVPVSCHIAFRCIVASQAVRMGVLGARKRASKTMFFEGINVGFVIAGQYRDGVGKIIVRP